MTKNEIRTMATRLAHLCAEHGADDNGFSVGELAHGFQERMAFGRIARYHLEALNAALRPSGIEVTSYALSGGLRTRKLSA